MTVDTAYGLWICVWLATMYGYLNVYVWLSTLYGHLNVYMVGHNV